MAEFRSSARSTGFNAINVPDNARRIQQEGEKKVRDLRRVYEQTIEQKKQYAESMAQNDAAIESQLNRNDKLDSDFRSTYKQALRTRQTQKLKKLKDQQKLEQDKYERLGSFSKGAMKLGKELYDNNKEERQAYGLSLIMQTGVTAAELEELQNKEVDLEVEGAANNATVERLRANGAGAAEIKKLRDLNGWALYGAQKALAQQAKTNWYAYTNNPNNRQKKFNVNGTELSLQDAEMAGMSSERANIIGQMKAEFFKPYSNYDLAFAEKYMFPGMREVDSINQQTYTTELNKQVEKQEQNDRYTEIGNALLSGDPNAFEQIINMRAPNGGPLRGAVREQMMDDLLKMAQNGTLTNNDLANIRQQVFTINGKQVTFSDQFLKGKGRFSPTGVAFAEIQETIQKSDLEKQQIVQQEAQQRRLKFQEDLIKTRKGLGGDFSSAEIKKIQEQWFEISGGQDMPQTVKNLLSNDPIGVEGELAMRAAESEADNGSLTNMVQIEAKYPQLTTQQKNAIARRAGIDPQSGNKVSENFATKYYGPLKSALAQSMDTINLLNPGPAVDAMYIQVQQRFDKELQTRISLDGGKSSTDDIAYQLMRDMQDQITKKEGFYETTGTGITGTFKNLNPTGLSDAQKLNNIEQEIDGDYGRLVGTERLLGGDPNQDPDSLAGQIPMIGQTGRAPDWLLNLARDAGQHWKTIFNAQAKAYGATEYLLPLSPSEGMGEIVRPQVGAFLGRHPSPANLQQASTQYERQRGVTGTDVYRPILNLIASEESSNDQRYDGYDSMNLGGTNGGHIPIGSTTGTDHFQQKLQDYTLGEIIQMGRDGQIHAAGRYQFVPITFVDMAERGWMPPGVSLDSPFDQRTQDLLGIAYFRQSIQDYESVNGDVVYGLGQRWIGLQKLDPQQIKSIVNKIQNDPRYQTPGFQAFEVNPDFEAARRAKYGGSR